MSQNKYLVKKVSVIDTLRQIPEGKTVKFDCRELGPCGSAYSAVSRLNKAAGYEAYKISSEDNGATYSITHRQRPDSNGHPNSIATG